MMKAAPIQSNLEKPEYDDILVFPEPGYDDIPALFFNHLRKNQSGQLQNLLLRQAYIFWSYIHKAPEFCGFPMRFYIPENLSKYDQIDVYENFLKSASKLCKKSTR